MMGDKSKFTSSKERNVGHVIFRDDATKKVKSIGNIEHVLPFDYFKYNFLSISHLCIRVIELFFSCYIAW
jgi:hypothetical protein